MVIWLRVSQSDGANAPVMRDSGHNPAKTRGEREMARTRYVYVDEGGHSFIVTERQAQRDGCDLVECATSCSDPVYCDIRHVPDDVLLRARGSARALRAVRGLIRRRNTARNRGVRNVPCKIYEQETVPDIE